MEGDEETQKGGLRRWGRVGQRSIVEKKGGGHGARRRVDVSR